MSKVSIIIPVHNTERYVEATLSTIFSQSYKDFEVILVDDGSTDNSGAIIDSYATRDNFKVFHKPCGGVSTARNMALDNLDPDSRYVMFVDSDDLLPNDAIEKLTDAMNSRSDAVMSFGTIGLFPDQDSLTPSCDRKVPAGDIVMTARESLVEFLHARRLLSQKFLCNRMFRTSIINDKHLRFDEGIHYKEDGLFIIRYFLESTGTVVCINDLVYLYRQVATSAMGSLNAGWNPRIMTNLDAHARILEELRSHNAGRRLVYLEIRNTFKCRRWILRRVISHRPGRFRATFSSLRQISRQVITAFIGL